MMSLPSRGGFGNTSFGGFVIGHLSSDERVLKTIICQLCAINCYCRHGNNAVGPPLELRPH